MKNKTSTIIEKISLVFVVLSFLYVALRIVMFVLVKKFDFVIYSRTLETNLWDQAWTWDIIMGFTFFLASSLYFNNKILPFIVLLISMFSCMIWILMMLGSKTLIPIEDTSLKENYAIYQYLYPGHQDELILVATVYKESYPLLYKTIDETRRSVSETNDKDKETIALFKEVDYKISDDGKTLSYGKFKVSLEKES